ncbi:hypothetical protein V6N11_083576 [Hibiscus sabdariffa]|uniref:Uncharacterized protein n=1 Tax=Hibiscus sabdariffa TaxID=183260 RepID=A0ABR2QBX3_9ROSI
MDYKGKKFIASTVRIGLIAAGGFSKIIVSKQAGSVSLTSLSADVFSFLEIHKKSITLSPSAKLIDCSNKRKVARASRRILKQLNCLLVIGLDLKDLDPKGPYYLKAGEDDP